MIPDKIYLHKIRDEESGGFHKMWFEQRARCVPSEEYIRKDALIEWLNGYNHPLTRVVVEGLIDKINSL